MMVNGCFNEGYFFVLILMKLVGNVSERLGYPSELEKVNYWYVVLGPAMQA